MYIIYLYLKKSFFTFPSITHFTYITLRIARTINIIYNNEILFN